MSQCWVLHKETIVCTIPYCLYHSRLFIPYLIVYTIPYCLYHTLLFIPYLIVYTIPYWLYHTLLLIPYLIVYTIPYWWVQNATVPLFRITTAFSGPMTTLKVLEIPTLMFTLFNNIIIYTSCIKLYVFILHSSNIHIL